MNTEIIIKGLLMNSVKFTKDSKLSTIQVQNISYFKKQTDETTTKYISSSKIINDELFLIGSEAVWNIIKQIAIDLKYCNCLWYNNVFSVNNNSQRLALNTLISMEVLIKTDLRNMYIVNPKYIRYGEYYEVLFSTLEIIKKELKTSTNTIVKPIKEYNE